MPDPIALAPSWNARPFIVETLTSKALHFSAAAIQSRMRLEEPDALDLDYTRLMMGFLLFNPRPKCLVMIGLGGGSLPKFCHRHLPGSRIEVIEINPQVIALRDQFHVPKDSGRFRVLQADGAAFVRAQTHRIDVLIVDGFDGLGQPPELASRRFYDDCHDSLAEGGVMVANLHSERDDCAPCVERIRHGFSGQVLLVDGVDGGNTIAFAFKGAAPLSQRAVARGRPARLQRHAAAALESAFASVERALQEFKALRAILPAGGALPAVPN
jgi:spermidine synthase